MVDGGGSRAEQEAVRDALRSVVLAANRFRYAMARRGDYSPREAALLAHLLDAGGQSTPGELAEQLLVSSGTLTAILRRLEERGDIRRSPHPDDLRAILVTLQPSGRESSAAVVAVLDEVAAAVAGELGLPTGELLRTLGATAHALDAAAQAAPPADRTRRNATLPSELIE